MHSNPESMQEPLSDATKTLVLSPASDASTAAGDVGAMSEAEAVDDCGDTLEELQSDGDAEGEASRVFPCLLKQPSSPSGAQEARGEERAQLVATHGDIAMWCEVSRRIAAVLQVD